MRFAPLTDELTPEQSREILGLYHEILQKWKIFGKRRSVYFYNRRVMFQYLKSLYFKTPYVSVLQNKISENAQCEEMGYLLKTEIKQEIPLSAQDPMQSIWDLFEQATN